MKIEYNILLAVSLREVEDIYLITEALTMAKKLRAKLSLIHAVEPIANYGVYAPSKIASLETQLQEAAQQKLAELAERFEIPVSQQIVLIGRPKTIIPEHAIVMNADLIIIGSKQHHELELILLGSTAGAILERAPCNVLAIRITQDKI